MTTRIKALKTERAECEAHAERAANPREEEFWRARADACTQELAALENE